MISLIWGRSAHNLRSEYKIWGTSSCERADSVTDLHTTGPGFKTRWVWYTFYRASHCLPPHQHKVERSLVCVEGQGRISWSGLTQDIKMGSCVFQCDVPHQWIARQVGPVSVYCHVLCLWHGIPVWHHVGESTIATSKHRTSRQCCDMTSDVDPNKQTKYEACCKQKSMKNFRPKLFQYAICLHIRTNVPV